jgi:hypothetical protein
VVVALAVACVIAAVMVLRDDSSATSTDADPTAQPSVDATVGGVVQESSDNTAGPLLPPTDTRVITVAPRAPRNLVKVIDLVDEPVAARESASPLADVVAELDPGTPVLFLERDLGWYLVDLDGEGPEEETGWVFGAFLEISTREVTTYVSSDGDALLPTYNDGDRIPDLYTPGIHAVGFTEPDGDQTLIYLPTGLVVYVDSAAVEPVVTDE